MNSIRFDELTCDEIAAIVTGAKKSGLILPIGCTEQHGPYLPVGCDTAIARGAAQNLAQNMNSSGTDYNAYVLPDFAYTPSPGAENMPGTLSTTFDWVGRGLKEIIASIIKTDWDFCVLMNGHAQNLGRAIETSMSAAQGELGRAFPVILINAYDFVDIFNRYELTPSSHAGEAEVALYSYYTGKKINNKENFPMNFKKRSKPSNIFGLSILERSHNGIISDGPVDTKKATLVCNEIGKKIDKSILDKVINNLNLYFNEWAAAKGI